MSDKVSRRQFAKLAGLSAAGIANPLEGADAKPVAPPPSASGFPAGFVWGTATSSYQVEGAVDEDGRGASIWDKFVRIPGKIEDGSTGDRANEHYHRYKEDIALIRELG
jgi:beta-glucosidase